MSLREQFGTNLSKETEGVEVKYGKNDDGTEPTFIISRMGKSNKGYMKALERALRPHKRAIDLKTMDNEVAGKILEDVFVAHVLKGWSNVMLNDITGKTEDKGKQAPYSREMATALFEVLPDLFDELNSQANDASNFRDAQLEDDAKN